MKRRAHGRWWDTRAEAGQSRRAIRYAERTNLARWFEEVRAASRMMSEFNRMVRRSIPRPWFKVDATTLAKHPPHRERREARRAERLKQKWTGAANAIQA
jgi:hypothetical protein